MLYVLPSIWVLRTLNGSQNMLFQCFLCKKTDKEEKYKFDAKFGKTKGFLRLHQNAGEGENMFFEEQARASGK